MASKIQSIGPKSASLPTTIKNMPRQREKQVLSMLAYAMKRCDGLLNLSAVKRFSSLGSKSALVILVHTIKPQVIHK